MLFHMFIAGWLFVRTKSTNLRYVYGALFFAFGFVLLRTGTRGATLGFMGGSVLAFAYLTLMLPKGASIKKWAAGGLAAIVLAAGSLWVMRDQSFVKENVVLSRLTNITLSEGSIRFAVWKVALQGVKERPWLGWGQENFSYVFNKYYEPTLYAAEPWYDRTHNIFMDWLIAGGILGLFAYLGILATALWYVHVKPMWGRFVRGVREDRHFSVAEQSLILGLLAAYTFHNLFVFDNLASWIFYGVILALIHSRVAEPIAAFQKFSIRQDTWERILVPFGLLASVVVAYMINTPGILAAQDIIDGYRAQTTAKSLETFGKALDRGSFAEQEIVEQMAQVGVQRIATSGMSAAEKDELVRKTSAALRDLAMHKPGDARLHMITGVFYRAAGEFDLALEELDKAKQLSPRKQALYVEEGLVFLNKGEKEAALESYRTAYELDTRSDLNRVRLAAVLAFLEDDAGSAEILDMSDLEADRTLRDVFTTDEMSLQLYHEAKRFDIVEYIFEKRREATPTDTVVRTNLAALYYEMGDKEKAIAVLREAIKDIPSFKSEGERLIKGLEAEK